MFDIKNITMIYDMEKTEKVYALGGFDLKLPDKGLVGIIGPSGSGKSTLMYCLSTLKKPTDGAILYQGKDLVTLKDSEREVLRRHEFGFVFQRHFLVPYMSAIDNVTVAATEKGNEVIEKGKKLLFDFGLGEKEISKRPAKLSGGQRQRIGIARSLYNDPDVLIMDEATSALDNDTEAAIIESINRLHGKKTLVIIAHRLQTIENCDMIYRVDNGKVLKER